MAGLSRRSASCILTVSFFINVIVSSCYLTKNVPPDDLALIQKKRNYLRIHSDNKIIFITDCRVVNEVLTGEVPENIENIKPDDIADIYIAPSSSINIDGRLVSLPVINIAKVDYRGHDALSISTGSVLAFLLLVFPGLFAM